jgi:GTP cyclohydrolase I
METLTATAQDNRRALRKTEMPNLAFRFSWEDCRELYAARIPIARPCYGVPRGGACVAALNGSAVDTPEEADIIVDDIVDSGRTREQWRARFPDKPFYALVDKTEPHSPYRDRGFVLFPWNPPGEKHIEDAVVRILEYIGENPRREGLQETPERVVRSWKELYAGYAVNPGELLKRDFAPDGYDELIVCREIDFCSMCEHHLMPFTGRAHVGYLPGQRIVGLSKLARLVEAFARRLQIQERMTEQIASALEEHLQPRGVGVVIEAQHFCMVCRGVKKSRADMLTSSLKGSFREPALRSEFLALIARH